MFIIRIIYNFQVNYFFQNTAIDKDNNNNFLMYSKQLEIMQFIILITCLNITYFLEYIYKSELFKLYIREFIKIP